MYKLNTILVILFFLNACDAFKGSEKRIINIGKMIIKLDTLNPKTREVADVVILGDHLVQKVALIKAHAKSYQLKVREGDLRYPYGDNRADYILTIHTDYQDIDIRLRYNNRKDKYDILGWMTANK